MYVGLKSPVRHSDNGSTRDSEEGEPPAALDATSQFADLSVTYRVGRSEEVIGVDIYCIP